MTGIIEYHFHLLLLVEEKIEKTNKIHGFINEYTQK